MSGDVQPRKRKDKKKKKEGSSLGNIHEPVGTQRFRAKASFDEDVGTTPIISSVDQGEKIHVHNEHGIGGNVCVKIIFFCLLGALVAAVGIIFIHSRGSTDVDLPSLEDSRFADYFTGWLDDAPDGHGHEESESILHDDEEHEDTEEQGESEDQTAKSEEEDDDQSEDFENAVDESRNELRDENDDSQEADDNEEENAAEENIDDSEEDDDENDDDEDIEESFLEETVLPKFKVVHRFRNFFNKRKRYVKDKSEEITEDVNVHEEDQEEEEEEDKESVIERADEVEEMSDENVEEEDHDQEQEEREETEEDDVEREEKEGEAAEERNDDKNDEDEDEVEDEDEDDEDDDENKKSEVFNLSKDVDDEEDIENKRTEDALGLEEIDESEEDEEDATFVKATHPETADEEGDDRKEASVMDAKVKLNQILRDKRKSVQQRTFEMEEAEIQPTTGEEEQEEEEEDSDTLSNGVAIKLIVGVALITVAYLVLIRKWKSWGNVPADVNAEEKVSHGDEDSACIEPIISRRQTLVSESSDLKQFFPNEIEEEEELEEESEDENYIDDDNDDDDQEYSEDEEPEPVAIKHKESSIIQDKSFIDEEYSEDEEEEEEEEDYEEEGDELEPEVDDEEYENEDIEEEEEEEDDDDEDLEEDDYTWKRKHSPKDEIEEEPPIPPPRTSHLSRTSGERGGPRGIDDFEFVNDMLDWTEGIPESTIPEETETMEKENQRVQEDSDWTFRDDFKFAEEQLDNNPKAALERFDSILSKKPKAVRALIGRAKALDRIAEERRSNQYLKQATEAYRLVLTEFDSVLDDKQYIELAERCLERMRFGAYYKSAIEVHKGLIRKFPNNVKHRNDLAVTYLLVNDIAAARSLLKDTLNIWPENGFALVHYGFILKTADNNHIGGAENMMAGIKTREPGVIDGRFFFHLGDALNRLGRGKEALEWYDAGVKEGLFLSRYQRSLYNVNRLKGQPWWTKKETTYQDFFKKLEDNWLQIKKEGLNLLNAKGVNLFMQEAENLKDTGDWRQLDLYVRGRKHSNCNSAPFTCSLIGSFHPASTCTRGQAKFSVMLPSTHVWPHCGPTNCRLRSHLGLVVPKNTFLRVAEETRTWEEGKVIIFDDSFEHEVWHNGTGARLVLIVDVWHPELTERERKYLSPI